MIVRLLIFAALAAACPPAGAVDAQPIVRLDASGGQVFFDDFQTRTRSWSESAAASADWLFAEGLSFTPASTLIPQVSGQYVRRSQVTQIAGGSIQVSQTLDDTAALRWVKSFGDWKVKPNVSYKSELISQDSAEILGRGLFDLGQQQAGLEVEWNGQSLKSVRQSFTVAKTRYYHYDPLRSPLFGAEVLVDRNALDFVSYAYSAAADYKPWEGGLVSASAEGALLRYGDQFVFEGNGLTSQRRQDWLGDGVLALSQRWRLGDAAQPWELSASVSGGFTELDSNQNDLDAGQSGQGTVANSDFYSYSEYSVGPTFAVMAGDRWRASVSYNYAYRLYRDRPAQTAAGVYESQRVWTRTHTAAFSAARALGKRWTLTASAGYARAFSDTGFQSYYLYSYSYPYYFLGFGYAL